MKKPSMIKFASFILIFIPLWGFSSEGFQWNLKAGAYNRVMGDESYIVAGFKPYFSYSKFYCSLDLEFQFDKEGALKQDDWDNWKAVKEKINVIGYGEESDPFFFRLGLLDDVTLGYGILVNHFRNDIYYPETKKLGLYGGYDLGYTGAAVFTEDTGKYKIFGGRVFIRPLYGLKNNEIPETFRMFQFGFSFVTDSDPMDQDTETFKPSMFGNDNAGSSPVRAYAIDMTIPIIRADSFTLDNYVQYGDIQKIGAGIGYGFTGTVIKVLEYKAEIIYSWGGFIPGYFSSFYDSREVRMNRFQEAQNADNGWGYLGGIYAKLFDKQLTMGIEVSGSKQSDPIMLTYANLKPNLLKRFFFKAAYQRKDISGVVDTFNFNDLGNKSTIILEIGYELTTNATISLRYIRDFVEENGTVKPNSITEIQTNLLF